MPACTAACTNDRENAHDGRGDADPAVDPLATLAAAIMRLPAAEKAKLAALLVAGDDLSVGQHPGESH